MSFGYDRLRFVPPVSLNDTIRARRSVKGVQEVAKHLLLVVERREVKTG
jgi:acyl dehydratase